jgi:hypothetical protein
MAGGFEQEVAEVAERDQEEASQTFAEPLSAP